MKTKIPLIFLMVISLAACASSPSPSGSSLSSEAPHSAGDHIKPPELGGPSYRVTPPERAKGDACTASAQGQCENGFLNTSGSCSPRPEVCTMQYDPVCGCDGKTYSNECAANSQGVSLQYRGECKA